MDGNQTLATQVSLALDDLDAQIDDDHENAVEQLRYKVQCAAHPAAELRASILSEESAEEKSCELTQDLETALLALTQTLIEHERATQSTREAFRKAQKAATTMSRHIGGRVYCNTCSLF